MKKHTIVLIAGLIAVLALSACAPSAASTPTPEPTEEGPIHVDITLTDFTVESSITEFEAGKVYEFEITNEGFIEHELRILPPLDGEEEDAHGDDVHDEALLVVEAADLGPGETATVQYTFDDHATEESLEFACHIAGHYEANMRLAIAVE